jgi:hypothetical protein
LPEPTTPAEALTRTLFLAIMATDEDQASRAMALAEDFAAELTEDEIEACKTAAQAQAFGPQYVAAEQAARHTINRAMSR